MVEGEAPSVVAPGESEVIWFVDKEVVGSAAAETPLVRLLREREDLIVEIAYSDIAGRVTASRLFLYAFRGSIGLWWPFGQDASGCEVWPWDVRFSDRADPNWIGTCASSASLACARRRTSSVRRWISANPGGC